MERRENEGDEEYIEPQLNPSCNHKNHMNMEEVHEHSIDEKSFEIELPKWERD